MANNLNIGVDFKASLGNLPAAAQQAAAAMQGFGNAAQAAGNVASHAYDEIAAGKAAMDRISAAIGKMVGEALTGATSLDKFASTTIKAITPLSTFEKRLEEIQGAIGRIGTVQGAAQLGVQFDLLNRNLQDTRKLIDDATRSAIGLSRAFATVSTASTSLNRLSPAIRPALTDLKLIPPAANAAAASLARIRPGANQAGAALTDVGRILQDLPFGFVGFQNNITQLPDSFKRLRDATGSTGGALKALAGSLMGAGGIGLLLSAVTGALTIATVGWDAWTRILGKGKKEAEENAKALQEFVNSLKSVEQITAEAMGSVAGQIAQVQALAAAVQDTNLSYAQRKRALQELQQVNKAYFGNLTLEEQSLASLTAKVDEYTKALVNQSIVKGFSDEIGRISVELGKQSLETDKLRNRLRQLNDQLAKTPRLSSNAQGVTSQSKAYSELVGNIQETTKQFNQQRDAEEKIATNRAILTSQLKAATIEGLKFLDLTKQTGDADKKAEDALRKRIEALKTLRDSLGLSTAQQRELVQLEVQLLQRDGVKLGFTPEEVQDRVDDLIKNTRFGTEPDGSIVASVPVKIAPTIDVAGGVLGGGAIPENAFDAMIEAMRKNAEKAKQQIGEIVIDVKSFLQSALTDAFIGLGETLGSVFQDGGLSNVFSGFIKLIGEAVTALGKAAIQAGTAALLAKKTIENFIIKNPALVIAAGVAVVAIGSALKNAFNNTKIPGFADGVRGFAGGIALVGERGPELVNLPGGSDVIPNHLLSVGNQLPVPSLFARGDDLYITYNRTAGRRRRI